MTMQLKRFLLIDDLDTTLVAEVLSQNYSDVQINRLCEKKTIRKYLQHCSPEDTVILLNAHVRFIDSDLRSNFLGMRFLRRQLRTEWRRREAAIVYSPLNREVFFNIPMNRILCANAGHYYYHIIQLRSIIDIVENAKPIEAEADLDEVIQRYGCLSGLIRTFKHDIENKLPVNGWKGSATTERSSLTQLDDLVQDLGILIPQRFHQEFQIGRLRKETHQLIDKLLHDGDLELKAHIIQIRSILSSYNKLYEQFFKA